MSDSEPKLPPSAFPVEWYAILYIDEFKARIFTHPKRDLVEGSTKSVIYPINLNAGL